MKENNISKKSVYKKYIFVCTQYFSFGLYINGGYDAGLRDGLKLIDGVLCGKRCRTWTAN